MFTASARAIPHSLRVPRDGPRQDADLLIKPESTSRASRTFIPQARQELGLRPLCGGRQSIEISDDELGLRSKRRGLIANRCVLQTRSPNIGIEPVVRLAAHQLDEPEAALSNEADRERGIREDYRAVAEARRSVLGRDRELPLFKARYQASQHIGKLSSHPDQPPGAKRRSPRRFGLKPFSEMRYLSSRS